MNRKYFLVVIIMICIGAMLFFGGVLRNEEKDRLVSQDVLTFTELNEETVTPVIPKNPGNESGVTRNPYQSELEMIADEYLSAYFTNVALVDCPFYEGGGTMYRECLQMLLKKETANASQQNINDSKAKCEEHINKYLASERADGSNVVGEFNTICIAAYSSKL
jgi:hypothetical protein